MTKDTATSSSGILRVALPVPLRCLFDYLPPDPVNLNQIEPGMRVRVPFGKSTRVGLLIEIVDASDFSHERLKACLEVLDQAPLFPQQHLDLLTWASAYYHHPVGDVVISALPTGIRKGLPAERSKTPVWFLQPKVPAADDPVFKRAHKQAELIDLLKKNPQGLSANGLQILGSTWRSTAKRMEDKEWLKVEEQLICSSSAEKPTPEDLPDLNNYQAAAVDSVTAGLSSFGVYLLDGVTGSGKTEVYFRVIEQVVSAEKQALVLIPEIGLTAQLIARFERRFNCLIAIMHSGMNDSERLQSWLQARDGSAQIIIGTRSAVWTPLARPGVIVVDEEHDLSYKQQDGFRYSARDVAILRSQREQIPIILGSATPSLESLSCADQGRYQRLILPERAGTAVPPAIRLLDIRRAELEAGLSQALIDKIDATLKSEKQALLFLNRRGFSPVMMCHSCGWVPSCRYCDAHMTFHQRDRQMRCHHCGAQQAMISECLECEDCNLIPVGQGTERITETLENIFPDARILRIDRDSTRKKGEMSRMLEQIHKSEVDILVGTQMLSKGHHFPNVTLVGVLDADHRLYSADFRATERLVQLIIQVAGRAGRAEHSGEVIIQTHHPDHPLLKSFAAYDFTGLTTALMAERQAAQLPPFSSMVLIRAEAQRAGEALAFLQSTKACIPVGSLKEQGITEVEIWGPVVAQMEKRAGRYRAQMIILSKERRVLQWLLTVWIPEIEKIKRSSALRWSVDVDPQDTF